MIIGMQSEKLKSSYGCALMVFREKYSEQSPSQQTLVQVLLYIASNIHEEVVLLTWRAGKECLFPLNGMSLKVNYLNHLWKRILSVCTSISIFECIQYYLHTIQFCAWQNTNIYFCLGISFLFINIASIVQKHCLFTIQHTLNMPYLWKWLSSKQYCFVCYANKHHDEILYLVTSFHYYSPLGFVFVLIWSSLNIKLWKITANKFCDMTFCLRCLHFKPMKVYKYIPLFSLPKIKKRKESIIFQHVPPNWDESYFLY